MDSLYLNQIEIANWFRDNGDNTHNLNYDLNENSIIMDLGGYTGVWAQQMINKYNPFVYIIEPVPQFYFGMVDKFKTNDKVKIANVGVGTENKDDFIIMSNDGTSSNLVNGEKINVKFNTIETILNNFEINEVDLIQINIEGDEYPLLEYMLKKGSINKFKNIQVQFHNGIRNDVIRRENIHNGLIANGFKNKFNYPFVWESWEKINISNE